MSHDNEYDTNTVKMLELVWGRGYMAPGGPGNAAASELGLGSECRFQVVEAGPLPFPNEAFDIVISSGAITQTPDKDTLIRETLRTLTISWKTGARWWLLSTPAKCAKDTAAV